MALSGFTAAAAKVVLGVESEAFTAGIRSAEMTFGQATAGMAGAMTELQEKQLRASAAADKFQIALKRYGPASYQAKAALAGVAAAQREVALQAEAGTKGLGRFERGALAAESRSLGLGRAIGFASNAFIGGAGFVFAIHSAVEASSKFHGEMELLHTQALATQKEVERMTASVMKLGPALGTSPQVLATGLYHVESAGIRGARALQILTTAAKGAKLGHADLEAVTNALVAAQKSGIRGVQNMSQAMGALDAIVGTGNMRMEDLAQSLSSGVLPVAARFGLSLHDVGAALAVLTDAGVPAQEAATRLRMSFSLLANQTPVAERQLASIGITTNQLGETLRHKGLVSALELLQTKLKNSGKDATEQAAVLTRAFGGGRSSATILTLLGQLGQVKTKFDVISKASGEFNSRWIAETHQAEFAFAKLGASLDVLKIRAGNVLAPEAAKASDAISHWIAQEKNQERVTRDVSEAFHDAHMIVNDLMSGFQQLGDVVHGVDVVLGGSGQTLKMILEVLAIRKLLGFATAFNSQVLNPIRELSVAAGGATKSVTDLQAAQERLAATNVSAVTPTVNQTAAAFNTEAASATAASDAVTVLGTKEGLEQRLSGIRFFGSTNPVGVGPFSEPTGPGYRAGQAGYRSGFSSGGEDLFLVNKSTEDKLREEQFAARQGLLGRANIGPMGALGLALGGSQIGRVVPGQAGQTLGSIASDAGFGALFAPMLLRNTPRAGLIGAGIGAGYAIHKALPGTAGKLIGDTTEGAALGAFAGTLGGPLAPLTVPVGAAIGGAGGLLVGLASLARSARTTADDIKELGDRAAATRTTLAGAKQRVEVTGRQVAQDRVQRDEADAEVAAARAQLKAATSAHDHKVALDELNAAIANQKTAVEQLNTDLSANAHAHGQVRGQQEKLKTETDQTVAKFIQLGTQAQNTTHVLVAGGKGASSAWVSPAERVHIYAQKMEDLAKKLKEDGNPQLAASAQRLADIATAMGQIPDAKTVNVTVAYGATIDAHSFAQVKATILGLAANPMPGVTNPFFKAQADALTGADTANDGGNFVDLRKAIARMKAERGPGGKRVYTDDKIIGQVLRWHPGWSKAYATALVKTGAPPPLTTGGGGGGGREEFTTDLPKNLVLAEGNAYGHPKELAAVIREEIAFLEHEYTIARTTDQRIAARNAINQLKSNLASTVTAAAGGKPTASTIVPSRLRNALQDAIQSGSKTKELAAYEAIAQFLKDYKVDTKHSQKLRDAANKQLTAIDAHIVTLSKTLTFAQTPEWQKLQAQVADAKTAAKLGKADVPLLKKELATAQQFLKQHPGDKDATAAVKRLKGELGIAEGGGSPAKLIAAYKAELKFLEHERLTAKTVQQAEAAARAEAAVQTALASARKGGAAGSFKKNPTFLKLSAAVDTAAETPETSDDLKALRNERGWLVTFLKSHSVATVQGNQANKLLSSIDQKIAKLVKVNDDQLAALERQFLQELKNADDNFGSNVGASGRDRVPLETHVHFHDGYKPDNRRVAVAKHVVQSQLAALD